MLNISYSSHADCHCCWHNYNYNQQQLCFFGKKEKGKKKSYFTRLVLVGGAFLDTEHDALFYHRNCNAYSGNDPNTSSS